VSKDWGGQNEEIRGFGNWQGLAFADRQTNKSTNLIVCLLLTPWPFGSSRKLIYSGFPVLETDLNSLSLFAESQAVKQPPSSTHPRRHMLP
jgi:hypothetical protein